MNSSVFCNWATVSFRKFGDIVFRYMQVSLDIWLKKLLDVIPKITKMLRERAFLFSCSFFVS